MCFFSDPLLTCSPDSHKDLTDIDAQNALAWRFTDDFKGPEEALAQIKLEGCKAVDLKWVEAHWPLIVWKLACLIRAKPALLNEGKWSWHEVIRQLKYRCVLKHVQLTLSHSDVQTSTRYEREVNHAHRSAIKRIQEQDSPSSLPLVLCVMDIVRHQASDASNSSAPQPTTSLILTDGWYQIRANVDVALQRAIDAKRLRIGYKIAISGARVRASRHNFYYKQGC